MKFVFFSVSENKENGLGYEGADGGKLGNTPSEFLGYNRPREKLVSSGGK